MHTQNYFETYNVSEVCLHQKGDKIDEVKAAFVNRTDSLTNLRNFVTENCYKL